MAQIPAGELRAATDRPPPPPPALLTLTAHSFPLMFTSGTVSIFYLILLPADFSVIHPEHNKTA